MAERADGGVNGEPYRLVELLSSAERDFLVRRNGDQVKVSDFEGKIVGLYFSASWCGPCRRFTPKLVSLYEKLAPKRDFEVVFISYDEDQDQFDKYFSKMPWLAIPFSDSDTKASLDEIFEVSGIPKLVILDGNGKLLTDDGTMIIGEYGVESYPFSTEKLQELKAEEEAARKNQSLKSILVSSTRDFLVYNDARKVPVTELQGKTVGLLFSLSTFPPCKKFIPQLVEVYNKLKEKNFEIVMISLDMNTESFDEGFEAVPWLALPSNDETCEKLRRYFEIQEIPTLVIIGPDGKTLQSNVVEAIEDHGAEAYPFTSERMAAILEIEKARHASQTIQSLLISDESDFVIGNGGLQVPVSELVGRTVILYFSAHWSQCRAFSSKLIETYHKIKAKDSAFEVIFVSDDHSQAAFEEYFATMPFLALPYGDKRKEYLQKNFKVNGFPTLVVIGPDGKTVTKDARNLITVYGAEAHPFTEERLKKVDQEVEEMANQWPDEVKHALHDEHSLKLSRRPNYTCDACHCEGINWSYLCADCDFDLHPTCALEEQADNGVQEDQNGIDHGKQDEPSNEGWVCDGEACHKT